MVRRPFPEFSLRARSVNDLSVAAKLQAFSPTLRIRSLSSSLVRITCL